MFGDPSTNPKGWNTKRLGELAIKFSDGPFGSNLKSEHYKDRGAIVIRLQNIGIGRFVDNSLSYISESHYNYLIKHECKPGDVVVATLGEPNLRACLIPDYLGLALNKADCVQIRVNETLANRYYIRDIINLPSMLLLANEYFHGQTRTRISMGNLKEIFIPLPPLALQQEFARRVEAVENLKAQQREHLTRLDELFVSLQHRAFRGEL